MKIAFLGTGRMGTELARKLLADHDVTVWNRSAERAQPLVDEGSVLAESAADAVAGADIVVSCLFGPDVVREVITGAGLIPDGVPWLDATTVGLADAREFAAAVPSYVATPVVGTLGPARAGKLGVYVGSPDEGLRTRAADVVAVWADPARLRPVDTAEKATAGKLLANLALAVSAQGLREALTLGAAAGLDGSATLDMLDSTGLAFIANMKRPFVEGERESSPGDFTVDAIAKDARLMLDAVAGSERFGELYEQGRVDADAFDANMPAVRAALGSLDAAQETGRGDRDFSTIFVDSAE